MPARALTAPSWFLLCLYSGRYTTLQKKGWRNRTSGTPCPNSCCVWDTASPRAVRKLWQITVCVRAHGAHSREMSGSRRAVAPRPVVLNACSARPTACFSPVGAPSIFTPTDLPNSWKSLEYISMSVTRTALTVKVV